MHRSHTQSPFIFINKKQAEKVAKGVKSPNLSHIIGLSHDPNIHRPNYAMITINLHVDIFRAICLAPLTYLPAVVWSIRWH